MLSMHVLERSTLGSILLYHPIFVYSRQGMDNFNQPLSFDTSSVKGITEMFKVRFPRSPAGAQLELLHHHLCVLSAGRVQVQPAAQL